ncbi:MAG: GGDEF domain-containing protein [Campylobacterota bacterium]|nr:GGDEF domain-containing protein [Campylobacterota bacterium]
MTKLYNRRYFSEISTTILELSIRHQKPLSLMMIDIDKFKNINDTYGHHIGDIVIISLANTLKELSRKSDIVCRFGGEEFLILLPETDIVGADAIAEKIRKSVEETLVDIEEEQRLKYTISTGISEVKIKEETNLEETIQRADKALYKAKEGGRNRVCKA